MKDGPMVYFHISNNMLVLHAVDDNGQGCDPMIRIGYTDTLELMQSEVENATPPNFCTLRELE
jgi:hypothetical protein